MEPGGAAVVRGPKAKIASGIDRIRVYGVHGNYVVRQIYGGGLTSLQLGVAVVAFIARKTWPGWLGVAAL
jgi:hypothetical protein